MARSTSAARSRIETTSLSGRAVTPSPASSSGVRGASLLSVPFPPAGVDRVRRPSMWLSRSCPPTSHTSVAAVARLLQGWAPPGAGRCPSRAATKRTGRTAAADPAASETTSESTPESDRRVVGGSGATTTCDYPEDGQEPAREVDAPDAEAAVRGHRDRDDHDELRRHRPDPRRGSRAVHGELVRLARRAGLLRRHPVPAHRRPGGLRDPAVRRPDRHRLRRRRLLLRRRAER